MRKNQPIKDSEWATTLLKMKLDIRSSRTMLIVFSGIAAIAKIVFKVPISWVIIFLMLIWFLSYFVYERLIKKAKTSQELYDIYFKYNISDLFLLTLIIHYLGAAEWIGAIFYMLVLVTSGVMLPKKRTVSLGFVALFFYSSLVLFEYLGILRHRPIFFLEPGLYQSPGYVGVQLLVIAAIFYFVADTAGTFSDMLREKTIQLEEEKERVARAYQITKEAREVLEIRVEARTKELRELAESLDEQVKQRTKELQKKIKELEKFQKVAVGRELKMVELKKEIKRSKGEFKDYKP